jgi:large subunit ribosomal protein L13Ae
MFEKEIIIDGKGHLLGRLASLVAKQLLRGQRIVVVRCEEMNISGSLFRNNLKYREFLNKSCNTNPRRHFKHYSHPSRMFWRTVRGMLPHKEMRGKAALQHLKVFEGIPYPYDVKKRMVVPAALKVIRLKPMRRFCRLGDLAQMAGWTKGTLISAMEAKRKAKSQKYFETKAKKSAARKAALGNAKVSKVNAELAKHGF